MFKTTHMYNVHHTPYMYNSVNAVLVSEVRLVRTALSRRPRFHSESTSFDTTRAVNTSVRNRG